LLNAKRAVDDGVELDIERVWLAVDLLTNSAVIPRGQGQLECPVHFYMLC